MGFLDTLINSIGVGKPKEGLLGTFLGKSSNLGFQNVPKENGIGQFIRGGITDIGSTNFLDFDPEMRELARQWTLGNTEMEGIVSKRWQQIEEQLKNHPEELQRVKDLFTGYVAEATAQVSKGGTTKKEQIASALKSANIFAGLKAGLGFAQAIEGAFKASKLEAPKLPEGLQTSNELASQITKAIYRSEQGDPKFRDFYESKIAEANEIDNYRAKVSGDLGQYAANIQGNAIQRTRAERELGREESKEKARNRAEVRQLLGMDLNERKSVQADKMQRFGVQEQRYQREREGLRKQVGSGINNVLTSLDSIMENKLLGGFFGTEVPPTGADTRTKGFHAITPDAKSVPLTTGGQIMEEKAGQPFPQPDLQGQDAFGFLDKHSEPATNTSFGNPMFDNAIRLALSTSKDVRSNPQLLSLIRSGLGQKSIGGHVFDDQDDGRPFDEKTRDNIKFYYENFLQ